MWARHDAEWRDPAQIASQWQEASETDPRLLQFTVRGSWWAELDRSGITLLVTREYEHLLMALTVLEGRPVISYMRLPHPSGLVVDRKRHVVHVASTRNPNQVYDFKPVRSLAPRRDVALEPLSGRPLVPVRSRFYPGSAYLHDLALRRGRAPRQCRRAERGGPPRGRWRHETRLVASMHRVAARAGLRPEPHPAQLHRRRPGPDELLLLRVDGRGLPPAPGPPELLSPTGAG